MAKMVFERGSADRVRGHALLYVQSADDPDVVLATYLLVLPVNLDIAKYIPPMLASQIPLADLKENVSALPLPPIPETVESREWVQRLAEVRDDDLIFAGEVATTDIQALMRMAARAAEEYGALYSQHLQSAQSSKQDEPAVEVQDVLLTLMSDRDRLAELVRLTGRARDAVDRGDRAQIRDALADIRSVVKYFPDKYRLAAFPEAVSMPGEKGRRLSELYLDRSYRICNEDYGPLEAIDRQIRELQG